MSALGSFVVRPETRFAHATFAAVIDAPGELYNPVVLYGAPGTGKTHLLRALADDLSELDVVFRTAHELARTPGSAAGADVVAVDDVLDSDDFDAIRDLLAAHVRSGRQVVLATRDDSPALAVISEWGAAEGFDRGLLVDVGPVRVGGRA